MVAALVAMGLGLACTPEVEPALSARDELPAESVELDPNASARERLSALEQTARETADFAALPASDGRFGPDPYRLIPLASVGDSGRFAGLLRGADQLVILDDEGHPIASAPAPHDPTDLALRGDELLVVGTGSGR
ncbi:MAG: hypothetical protein KC636_15045, partial [Myxococcales bacterium]|nr:hypothetical protein [Myxococcales bacterium]